MSGNEVETIFDYGHHAEAEEIDFDQAEVVAVFFVPLDDVAADHGGALEGNDFVEVALADDHAAGVLAEVAGEILDAFAELEVFGDALVAEVEAGVAELVAEGFSFLAPLPLADQGGEAGEGVGVEAEGFAAYLPR